MFTGIIEEVGRVAAIRKGSSSATMFIEAQTVLQGTRVGDSICVNGVCLTVTTLSDAQFSADVMPETMSRSSLKDLERGCPVNLERALRLDGRLGGHIVTGHIDGTGTIQSLTPADNAVVVKVGVSADLTRYVVEKGSVAMDGISLTVASVERDSFTVSIIPHTWQNTALFTKGVGSVVNVECDVIGKYVEKAVLHDMHESKGAITYSFLAENGFA